MTIGAVVGRLIDGKAKLIAAKHGGAHAAAKLGEAQQIVDGVLDVVVDKELSAVIGVHARAVLEELAGIDVLCTRIDAAIVRARGVGRSRR